MADQPTIREEFVVAEIPTSVQFLNPMISHSDSRILLLVDGHEFLGTVADLVGSEVAVDANGNVEAIAHRKLVLESVQLVKK